MDAPDAQHTEILSFRIDPALKRRIEEARVKFSINISLFVRQAVEQRLDEIGVEK